MAQNEKNVAQLVRRKRIKETLVYIVLVIWMLINLFPIYWMFTFSLKSNKEIFGENVIGLPREWLWSNYEKALKVGNIFRYFLNSTLVAIVTIAFFQSDVLP